MLTKNDVTIPDAFEVYDEVARGLTAEELPYVGFKNVGLPVGALRELGAAIAGDGRKLVIEIVGASADAEHEAAALAVELGAECLIGGTHTAAVLDVVEGSGVGYFPTVGDLTIEPGRLHGAISDIVRDVQTTIETPYVDGVMLLGYRYVGDVPALLSAVGRIPDIAVVNAGSVDSAERIRELERNGYWAFTIGSAVLDLTLPAGQSIEDQLRWVLDIAR
ncbi:hypothetical protein [Jiangella asiatica]|uniref:4-hydroxythreonine-4-phosphate dehydrogenase n=1 Tax=Jiangella asiatica TaxID=2530372 RepID=A0A4R5CQH9_9ACTN|nr:hypothetical protein [Jiangella asiatica]TDD99924.1 hypothetical protein E1269_27080 [Jiangella asiatica]